MNINKKGCLIIRYYVNGYIIMNIIFKKEEEEKQRKGDEKVKER